MKKKRNVNSIEILDTDEKKYLNRVCNYLNSLGIKDGTIDMEIEPGYFDIDEINWDEIDHFSNNYSAQIPDGLKPILIKIFNYINSENLYNEPDDDGINYESLIIDIDTVSKEISVNHRWSFYGRGDENSVEYDSQQDLEQFDNWRNDEFADMNIGSNGILTLKYNGSGDSGYIEDNFDENDEKVPAGIEDWCYRALENSFGGWEINEGSDGYFVFDFNNSMVTLYHTNNTEEEGFDTIYEESFAK